jgi:precorrin-2/cobalt-factor-2 C20-methyltransferase
VHKSSIYLPEALKSDLAGLAARSGRSEAQLVRQAIERLLAGAGPQARADDAGPLRYDRPSLVGVGVGPGDPGLVTRRAHAVLRDADRVIVTTTDEHSVGRAEMVVRAVAPTTRIQRVPFTISGDAGGRLRSLSDLGDVVIAAADAGELVAVAVLGDPSQRTVFPDLADEVRRQRPDLPVATEPGIASYQAAAAGAGARLGAPGRALVVVDRVEDLDRHLTEGDAVVLYKASTDAASVQAIARDHGRADGVVAELAGMPGERIVPVAEAGDGPIAYLATVVFPSPGPSLVGGGP